MVLQSFYPSGQWVLSLVNVLARRKLSKAAPVSLPRGGLAPIRTRDRGRFLDCIRRTCCSVPKCCKVDEDSREAEPSHQVWWQRLCERRGRPTPSNSWNRIIPESARGGYGRSRGVISFVNIQSRPPGFACAHVSGERATQARTYHSIGASARRQKVAPESRWPALGSFSLIPPKFRTSKSRWLRSRWDAGHASALRSQSQSPCVLPVRRSIVREVCPGVGPSRASNDRYCSQASWPEIGHP